MSDLVNRLRGKYRGNKICYKICSEAADKIEELQKAGNIMSNILFNMKQKTGYKVSNADCESMATAQGNWDYVIRIKDKEQ